MTARLAGKVAIVTGAGRGIGSAVARALGRQGASVVVNYAHNHSAAKETVAAIEAGGSRALAVQAELNGEAAVRALFDAALAAFGRVDMLVNNAAIARFAKIDTVTEVDQTVAVNVKAAFFAFQQAALRMADGGRIVSISAAMTAVGYENTVLYAGTKGALEQFGQAAAKELGKRSIVVNTVSPGATETELYLGLSTEAGRAAAAQRSPFGRIAKPEDIADVVAFLCGPEARWLSGERLRVNGAALF
ncbi:SDR family oxidoreductase [Bradyrhizobium sp. sBnM-33]|uniref:SDR family oxidoreductase n=1 Tax=Bradyrhizobium sp. sBnM-33 TaxID=2831780 RepID=UPI001BD00BB8|nr:SDR family oxidoreductase [Bradyrhizobium sp. sBnM-33]WOH53097.1 SDR family oxidoreductase [Bradyrhizobium sp. sBnM-33]